MKLCVSASCVGLLLIFACYFFGVENLFAYFGITAIFSILPFNLMLNGTCESWRRDIKNEKSIE
jgi:hypothetical protein